MPETLAALIISALSGGAGGAFIYWISRTWIDQYFARRMEEFKHGLDKSSQSAAFDYQRKLVDYNLFIERKHSVLAELHKVLLEAMSRAIRVAKGHYDRPTIEDMNARDASAYMSEHEGIGDGKRVEILGAWDVDRAAAVKALLIALDTFAREKARRAQVEANNYRLRHELYLTDEAARLAKEVCDRTHKLVTYAVPHSSAPLDGTLTEATDVRECFGRLRRLLKDEISRADLEELGRK